MTLAASKIKPLLFGQSRKKHRIGNGIGIGIDSEKGTPRKVEILAVAFFCLLCISLRNFLQADITPTPRASISLTFGGEPTVVADVQNITVLVDFSTEWKYWGLSFFEARQLKVYGRHNFQVEWLNFAKESERLEALTADTHQVCVLVADPKNLEDVRRRHAPHCKTWILYDEFCKSRGDIRHYYKQETLQQGRQVELEIERELYVPLGPRYDFDKAYHRRSSKHIQPTSQRAFKFNAIFSQSTSLAREELTKLLDKPEYRSSSKHKSKYFIQTPVAWKKKLGKHHVDSSRYVDILGQSQFTLSPTGHNPECFRFWESILMGSIPILVIGDEEYLNHDCPNALLPLWEFTARQAGLRDAEDMIQRPTECLDEWQQHLPFVVLQNWSFLESTLADPRWQEGPALDAFQKRMMKWQMDFMKEKVWRLEDYLLASRSSLEDLGRA